MASRFSPALSTALTALTLWWPALAQEQAAPPPPDEVQALRREIQELRDQIQALREQVDLLSAAASSQAPSVLPAPPPPSEPAPPPAAAGVTAPARSPSLLNPAISAVFQVIGNTSLLRESDDSGFDLSEAEVAFQSVVDPYAKVDLFLSFPAGESPEVEEGYLTTLALPHSLQLKGGRFKNAFGKWNALHTHAFFTVERPDALVNFFGEESLTTDGLSLSFLIPNPWDLYLDSITEIGTALPGASFNSERHKLTYLEHLAVFFNTTANSTLEVGLTAARGRAGPTERLRDALDQSGLTTLEPRADLDSAVQGFDVTYKWKPLQLNVYRSFLWQTEVLRSHREVETLTPVATLFADTISSLGGYTYLEWQFVKRWRSGVRYDVSGFPDAARDREQSGSVVVRFLPSEFQELRFQIKHTRRNDAAAERFDGELDDTRIFFEWIPVIGAHGAHKY